MYWKWQPCERQGCPLDPNGWTIVGNSLNTPETIPSHEQGDTELLLTFRNKESGFYQCVGTNSEATATDEYLFLVSGGYFRFECKNHVVKNIVKSPEM